MSMKMTVSDRVLQKLEDKHGGITVAEIRQCFANKDGPDLIDGRANNLTNPVTRWFIAETDRGVLLKIAFMQFPDRIEIKTAYPPNETEIKIYKGNMR